MASETTKPKFRGEPVDEDKARVKNVIRYEDGGRDVTVEQFKQQLQKVQAENKALQLRILGVNELARLLQDRTEVTEVLQEKNKRLEVAVVRLENRCSNFERKLRAQGGGVVGPKPGQSPFIPGPSRQILEALMKENSELKKTLNNLTKKGATGYLEAVKTTQLEEVIDNQTQEIEFLKSQIQSLTTSGLGTEEDRSSSEVSLGLGSSFNSSASVESGPLKQQLIKLRNALRVKDRFNSLLCQKVAEFEDRVKQLQSDVQPDGNENSVSAESGSGHVMQDTTTHDADPYSGQIPRTTQVQESTEYHDLQVLKKKLEEQKAKFEQVIDDQGKTLLKERDERMQLVSRMGEIEKELKTSKSELDSLNSRCEDLSTYNQTLVEEKSQLTKMLSDAEQKISGSESWTRVQQLEQELREHEKLSQEQVKTHSDAVQEKEKEINNLRLMLEDAQYKYVIADSKLGTIENEKKQEIEDLKEKVEDLERDVDAFQSENQELRQRTMEMHHQLSHMRASTRYPPSSSHMHTRPGVIIPGCGPVLKVATHSGPIEGIRDGGKPPPSDQRRAYSQQLPGHCGENIIENPIRQEIQLISRFPEDPPVTTSAQKPSSLNIHSFRYQPTHASYSHPLTAPSPSQFIGGNMAGIQNTPTTPLAPNQPTRSHSPMHPPHPRHTTPFHTTAAGSIYYTRQPSTTASTVASYYPQITPKPVYGAPGYSPSGTNVPSMPSMGSSGYGSIVSGPTSDFMPQGQSLSPHLNKQSSKESAYGSMSTYPSGLGQTSLSPHSPHHVYDHRQYSPQGYHHGERRSSSPLPHDYNYQQHQ